MLSVSLKTLVWLHFEWNRAYIEKELCEKRDEVHNCCKGNCYLTKKLNEEPSTPSEAQPNLPKHKELSYYQWIDEAIDIIPQELSIVFISSNEFIPVTPYSNSVFHPPARVVFA